MDRGREQRLLHGVLGGSEIAEAPDDGAEHLRREFAQQMLGIDVPWLGGHSKSRYRGSSVLTLMICRTSIGILKVAPPGPGPADSRAAIS